MIFFRGRVFLTSTHLNSHYGPAALPEQCKALVYLSPVPGLAAFLDQAEKLWFSYLEGV